VPVAIQGGNSIYVATADGTILSPKDYPNQRQADIEKGIAAFLRLPESKRKPAALPVDKESSRGSAPDGCLVSRVYMRAFGRDREGFLTKLPEAVRDFSGPQRDFLWLTETEWKSLVPKDPKVGQRISGPEPIADRIARFYLNDRTRGIMGDFWSPEDLREHWVDLIVDAVNENSIELRLDGVVRLSDNADAAKAERRADYGLDGRLTYSRRTETFDRFDILAIGEYYDVRPITKMDSHKHYFAGTDRVMLGMAFELARPGSLGYGTRPLAIYNGDRSRLTDYFGQDLDARVLSYFRSVQ
jgi:hypothetical protein